MNSHERFLRDAAIVMHREGDVAWGNTCEAAADEIDRLSARNTTAGERISTLERVASDLRRQLDEAAESIAAQARTIADLSAALVAACEIVQVDRMSLYETSCNRATGAIDDPDDQAALDDYDRVIAQADAALGEKG